MQKVKAIALYSGGLDSILACRVVMKQGIEVYALRFITPFFGYDTKGREQEVERSVLHHYGIQLKVVDVSHEYLNLIRHPQHGYGKHFNPCLDCKIFMVSKAREYLEEIGASFIITGEVLGQRPMSQRRDALRVVERDSGAEGILLRPLSAKHLPPTIPEKKGWVNRDGLLDVKGRGRKTQITLAQQWDIKNYPTPAGGCMLTDPQLSSRVRWLCNNRTHIDVKDILLVRIGRHFAFPQGGLLVVGRAQEENQQIAQLIREGDVLLELSESTGPLSLFRGPHNSEVLTTAASITVRYSKARGKKKVAVIYRKEGEHSTHLLRVDPIDDQLLPAYRISNPSINKQASLS